MRGLRFLARGKLTGNFWRNIKTWRKSASLPAPLAVTILILEAAKGLGILVCNANYAPDSVADFTIMMMLMCLRQYKQAFWRGYVNDFSLGRTGRKNFKRHDGGRYGNRSLLAIRSFRIYRDLAAAFWRMMFIRTRKWQNWQQYRSGHPVYRRRHHHSSYAAASIPHPHNQSGEHCKMKRA